MARRDGTDGARTGARPRRRGTRRDAGGNGRSSRNGANGNGNGNGSHGLVNRAGRLHRGVGASAAARRANGTLVIVGGREDKKGDRLILTEIARRVGGGKLVVATVASNLQREQFEEYEAMFRGLGVKHVHKLQVETRADAFDEQRVKVLEDASAVFFTGGDQLKITSQLGDSPIYERIRDIYESGGLIAGTSAGASVMSETMMVSGAGDESYKIGGALHMAPGFGLIQDVLVDQHFAERGRMGRLIGAVAQNPRMLGVGIDEDTAIVVDDMHSFEVIGSGAVYVVDGGQVTYSNLTDEGTDRTLSVFGLTVHVLSQGDVFDLATRTPTHGSPEAVEERLGETVESGK